MNHLGQFLTILCFASLLKSGQEVSQVFVSGTYGYESFRIPAVISLPGGKLLAFAEGRVNGSNDFGDIDIVMKSSHDDGKTWSNITSVVNYGNLQAGNPAPVVDLADPQFPHGRIFLFYNSENNHEGEVRKGNGYREVWYITSSDSGATWSAPVNITASVHRLNKPEINPQYSFSEDWRSYANTPGHAMQFTEGLYRGRIVVAANHSSGEPGDGWEDYSSHAYFTDDHGKTFSLSQPLGISGSNEATAAEISGNRLILNARNQKGDIRARIVAVSNTGGESWDSVWFDSNLPDPVCQGSILTIGDSNGRKILAFCNAADKKKRNNLTLRISFDEGKKWQLAIPVDSSSELRRSNDYTAYSDIVKISANEIGILYERDDYREIVFRVIRWD